MDGPKNRTPISHLTKAGVTKAILVFVHNSYFEDKHQSESDKMKFGYGHFQEFCYNSASLSYTKQNLV